MRNIGLRLICAFFIFLLWSITVFFFPSIHMLTDINFQRIIFPPMLKVWLLWNCAHSFQMTDSLFSSAFKVSMNWENGTYQSRASGSANLCLYLGPESRVVDIILLSDYLKFYWQKEKGAAAIWVFTRRLLFHKNKQTIYFSTTQ